MGSLNCTIIIDYRVTPNDRFFMSILNSSTNKNWLAQHIKVALNINKLKQFIRYILYLSIICVFLVLLIEPFNFHP